MRYVLCLLILGGCVNPKYAGFHPTHITPKEVTFVSDLDWNAQNAQQYAEELCKSKATLISSNTAKGGPYWATYKCEKPG